MVSSERFRCALTSSGGVRASHLGACVSPGVVSTNTDVTYLAQTDVLNKIYEKC